VLGLIPLYLNRGKKTDSIQSSIIPPNVNRTEIIKTVDLQNVVTLEITEPVNKDYSLFNFDLTIITKKVNDLNIK